MTHGHSLVSFHSQDNGRSVPDLTASPGRAPHPGPGHMQSNQQNSNMQRMGGVKEPVLLQGDFRKVSGISSEIFRQIEGMSRSSVRSKIEIEMFTNFKFSSFCIEKLWRTITIRAQLRH